MSLDRFPGAPPGAYVLEPEGWLVYRDQAWTEEEWQAEPGWRPSPTAQIGRPRLPSSDPKTDARRQYERERKAAYLRRIAS